MYTLEKKNYIHKRKFLLEDKYIYIYIYIKGKKKKKNHKPIHSTDQQIKILFCIKGK
jgi:hypothetical protein